VRFATACLLSAAAGALLGGGLAWRYLRGVEAHATTTASAEPASGSAGGQLPRLWAQASACADELERLRRECRCAPTEPTPPSTATTQIPQPERRSALAFPADLESRFRGAALVETFGRALASTGITGEVTKVDCSEFPCLVHGEVVASESLDQAHADAQRLQQAAATSYSGADSYFSMSDFTPANPGDFTPSVLWTASFFPSDLVDELRQQVNQHVNDRKKAYVDAQLATLRTK
jgi:hypothetical protein